MLLASVLFHDDVSHAPHGQLLERWGSASASDITFQCWSSVGILVLFSLGLSLPNLPCLCPSKGLINLNFWHPAWQLVHGSIEQGTVRGKWPSGQVAGGVAVSGEALQSLKVPCCRAARTEPSLASQFSISWSLSRYTT